jgi:hypothetical protein
LSAFAFSQLANKNPLQLANQLFKGSRKKQNNNKKQQHKKWHANRYVRLLTILE